MNLLQQYSCQLLWENSALVSYRNTHGGMRWYPAFSASDRPRGAALLVIHETLGSNRADQACNDLSLLAKSTCDQMLAKSLASKDPLPSAQDAFLGAADQLKRHDVIASGALVRMCEDGLQVVAVGHMSMWIMNIGSATQLVYPTAISISPSNEILWNAIGPDLNLDEIRVHETSHHEFEKLLIAGSVHPSRVQPHSFVSEQTQHLLNSDPTINLISMMLDVKAAGVVDVACIVNGRQRSLVPSAPAL